MSGQHAPNRLIHASSPYLNQHAGNPVDWYPWGEEAFIKAKAENKPVFLSIGYSTCHWCHVMAEESFEDLQVAELLNRHFVCVKVDREERPDIDAVYMQVCVAMNGSGGWPLTVVLTPDLHPFFAGTYFPKNGGYGQPGLMDILQTVARKWREDPESLRENGRQVVNAFAEAASPAAGRMTRELLKKARIELDARFDDEYGGFGAAPKFPAPHVLMFLLRYACLEQDQRALAMAEKTLGAMGRGGLYDHLGGGFSRYSTDRKWLIPHFEKMLYDNALLAMAYTEAFQITGKPLDWRTATATLDYLLREMRNPEGGFKSAQDADAGGGEGAYYTFTPGEIKAVLGTDEGERFCRFYGVTGEGVLDGRSVLNRMADSQEAEENLRPLRDRLYAWRKASRSLFTDDKALTEWNGLAIAALCKAAIPLSRPEYLDAAKKAMAFVKTRLTDENGELYAWWRDGKAGGRGGLPDYAAMAWACLAMYETEFDSAFVEQAEELCRLMVRKFFDEKQGDFFLCEAGEELIFRPKEYYDGASPCGNSMAAYVLYWLSRLTRKDGFKEYADRTVEKLAGAAQEQPAGYCFGLIAGLDRCYPPVEVALIAEEEKELTAFAKAVGKRFLPHAAIAARRTGTPEKDAPGMLKGKDAMGRPAAYFLCMKGACQPPVFSLMELETTLAPCLAVPGKAGGT